MLNEHRPNPPLEELDAGILGAGGHAQKNEDWETEESLAHAVVDLAEPKKACGGRFPRLSDPSGGEVNTFLFPSTLVACMNEGSRRRRSVSSCREVQVPLGSRDP